jgi:hypothetical protein
VTTDERRDGGVSSPMRRLINVGDALRAAEDAQTDLAAEEWPTSTVLCVR